MFSFCATANTLRSACFRAASMARNVAGRPAPIGVATPGNSTASRSGRTGKVIRSDMGSPIVSCVDDAWDAERTVHATKKRRPRQVRSGKRRQSGAGLPTRRSQTVLQGRMVAAKSYCSNGLQNGMNDPLAQRLSQALEIGRAHV